MYQHWRQILKLIVFFQIEEENIAGKKSEISGNLFLEVE